MSTARSRLLEDAMQDSWVDICEPYSNDSSRSSIELPEAVVSLSYTSAKPSPKSARSQNRLLQETRPTLEAVKFKLVGHIKPSASQTSASDWLWDWSSRPEALPPKPHRFRHPGGVMTTPPNSPIQTPGGTVRCYYPQGYTLSVRHTKIIRNDWFSVEVLSFFIVSNLLSLCIGYWICRKLAMADI